MPIEIVWGTSEGQTPLSAFDTALAEAGIHNYNLVILSSVIPGDQSVVLQEEHDQRWEIGEFVGVVLAENRSTVTGETISAGLGWATADEGGVFFEAAAESTTTVESLLVRGVETAKENRQSWNWNEDIKTNIVKHTVEENGAAIVSAIYRPV